MPSGSSGAGVRTGSGLKPERSSHTTRCVSRGLASRSLSTFAAMAARSRVPKPSSPSCVDDRREDGEFVSFVATPGAGQAKVEKFGEQPEIAVGHIFRRLVSSEDRRTISTPMAAEQVNQRLPEIAHVRTHPNAQQPRSQLFGGDNLLQLG